MNVKSEGDFYLFIVSGGGRRGKGYEMDSPFESVQLSQNDEEENVWGAIV